MKTQKINPEKETEAKILQRFKDTSETLSTLRASSLDMVYLSPAMQAYASYLNYISQEKSLKQIRITALATVALAAATFILALVTAFHP
jgi:hypothetical protein